MRIDYKRPKTNAMRQVISEAARFLEAAGIPLDGLTGHRTARMAMAFLAVGAVARSEDWPALQDADSGRAIKTREMIAFINAAFDEAISPESYDDIRRKDLVLLVAAGIVRPSKPGAARNDSTRGYALAPPFAAAARLLPDGEWREELAKAQAGTKTLAAEFDAVRLMQLVPIRLPDGMTLEFSPGEHNRLQKAIIEEFLPRYGYGAEVLYVGDAADKFLYYNAERLKELNFAELAHGKLPDVIAYSAEKNWLYLMEAVHTSGPISPLRKLTLFNLAQKCAAQVIYVSAFANRGDLQRFVTAIAWETEVWIANAPDHLIHWNGDRFLGPHPPRNA